MLYCKTNCERRNRLKGQQKYRERQNERYIYITDKEKERKIIGTLCNREIMCFLRMMAFH